MMEPRLMDARVENHAIEALAIEMVAQRLEPRWVVEPSGGTKA
jgi:hypothetical protein